MQKQAVNRFNKRRDQYIAEYEGSPPEDPMDDLMEATDDIFLNGPIRDRTPASFFTSGTDSYDAFGQTLTTELANHAAIHALESLSRSTHSDWLGFNLPREVKSTN